MQSRSRKVVALPRGARINWSITPMLAAESQSVEGAPRRRAAPGNQSVKVAAAAATGRQTKCCASAGIEETVPGRANEAPRHVRVPQPKVSHQPRPCADAQRLRLSFATAGVGASAHARHASAAQCRATTRPPSVVSECNAQVRGKYTPLSQQAPNPSIERTPKSQLRCLLVTAHVER